VLGFVPPCLEQRAGYEASEHHDYSRPLGGQERVAIHNLQRRERQ
jgi:hypothetical protein